MKKAMLLAVVVFGAAASATAQNAARPEIKKAPAAAERTATRQQPVERTSRPAVTTQAADQSTKAEQAPAPVKRPDVAGAPKFKGGRPATASGRR
ncbi:MAG TPA: hypothetical protein VGB67_10170 [Fibrella sp.]